MNLQDLFICVSTWSCRSVITLIRSRFMQVNEARLMTVHTPEDTFVAPHPTDAFFWPVSACSSWENSHLIILSLGVKDGLMNAFREQSTKARLTDFFSGSSALYSLTCVMFLLALIWIILFLSCVESSVTLISVVRLSSFKCESSVLSRELMLGCD